MTMIPPKPDMTELPSASVSLAALDMTDLSSACTSRF